MHAINTDKNQLSYHKIKAKILLMSFASQILPQIMMIKCGWHFIELNAARSIVLHI